MELHAKEAIVSHLLSISYFVCFTRETKEIGDVCTQAKIYCLFIIISSLRDQDLCLSGNENNYSELSFAAEI